MCHPRFLRLSTGLPRHPFCDNCVTNGHSRFKKRIRKERVAEQQPGWSALQDTFMLGKSRLKDWDKKQDDGAGAEGSGNSDDDSDMSETSEDLEGHANT
ncbi:hypothetical protein GOP47_0008779 [Adiantum capillus-veneris]|uniref:Uncharacterized protein n=1 Tax=Adiantum capillus-veneris TaxID=13818 RepID=A0A9D4UZ79_ADICA|nr:hypothetical protein GOP47_0008779 [Adiantum capillus-veneris]